MGGKGRIEIAADAQDATAPRSLSHGELVPGTYVRLAVGDTGPGFDENVARQLFEPFFTTRMAGTGLGLATVREIVRDHEGAMNVSSIPGQGSRFETWLPATGTGIGLALREGEAAPLPLGRGETVLVVESERARLLGGEEILAALGYEPVGFERPVDALAASQAAPERFDAILISYASAAQALDLARSLHDVMPRQPILLATASAIDIGLDALTTAGVSELLRRPLASPELAAALTRCLSSRPQYARKPIASV